MGGFRDVFRMIRHWWDSSTVAPVVPSRVITFVGAIPSDVLFTGGLPGEVVFAGAILGDVLFTGTINGQ